MATRGGDKRGCNLYSKTLSEIYFCWHFLGRSVKQEELKEEETTSKTEARSKLNKALENAEAEKEKEQEPSSSESESEKQEESVASKKSKVKAEKEDSPVVKEHKIPKLPKPSQQASYIMKLFDRSVNLAKFTEDIPLYPLCRSWMSNAPRQLPVKTEKSIDAVLHVEEGDVVEMPKGMLRKFHFFIMILKLTLF